MTSAPARHASPRAALLCGLLATLALWEAFAAKLPDLSDPWDVTLTCAVLIPVTFGVVWLALPLARLRGLVPVTVALGALAVLLGLAGLDGLFNVTKLLAYTLAGFAFLTFFEALSWVVLVSFVIPWVDIASVYHGPTKVVVEEKPGVFEQVAVSFALPGEDAFSSLGPPDVIFFALFLATAARYGLRLGWTWLGMTGALALVLVGTYVFDLNGAPALPAISLGLLLANADILWGHLGVWRTRRAGRASP